MSVKSQIAIFAGHKAQSAYLAELVLLAGYEAVTSAGEQTLAAILVEEAGFSPPIPAGLPVLKILEEGHPYAHASSAAVLPSPVRASVLIEALTALMAGLGASPETLMIGDNTLDVRQNSLQRADGEIFRLTEKETAILVCLTKAQGASVTRDTLLQQVWEYVQGVETHTLETHIYRLRQKIEIDPSNPKILLTQDDGYTVPV